MRFKKIEPKETWSAEKTHDRIVSVQLDIASFNRAMNRIDGQMNALVDAKKTIARKASYKWKYLRQLEAQYKSTIELPNSEVSDTTGDESGL